MSCSCGRIGCSCKRPDCANGWLLNDDNEATACTTCKPGWRPHDERVAERAAIRAKEAEDKRREHLAAAAVDADRQRGMFGDPDDGQGRWPELGRDGG